MRLTGAPDRSRWIAVIVIAIVVIAIIVGYLYLTAAR
jgi:hypothetical protein